MIRVDLTKSPRKPLPLLEQTDAKALNMSNKGWSLSSVYNLTEIRDIFVALRNWKSEHFDLKSFSDYCNEINLPFIKSPWKERRILEHLNALKNFGLLSAQYQIVNDVFSDSIIGSSLTEVEQRAFKDIYFNYFRFREIFSWFIDPQQPNRVKLIESLTQDGIENNSRPLFFFSERTRFTDSFIQALENDTPIFTLKEYTEKGRKNDEDLMRFWDLFCKWGSVLQVIERFNLRSLDIKTTSGKNIACAYVISHASLQVDLFQYLEAEFSTNYVYLPDLVLNLALRFRFTIDQTHDLIIDQYKKNKQRFSLERTSEIFIKKTEIREGDKIFFPKYNDSYISHLIVRR
jgi:hypothetical protein